MNITLDPASSDLSRTYAVTLAASDIDQRLERKLATIATRIRLPGFRPGKAPVKLLKRRYAGELVPELMQDAVSDVEKNLREEHNIRPARQMRVENVVSELGQDFSFSVRVDCLPEISAMAFKDIKLVSYKPLASDKFLDDGLSSIAKRLRDATPVTDRATQAGDRVTYSQVVRDSQGEKVDHMSLEELQAELGDDNNFEPFEEAFAGRKTGETCEYSRTYEDDHPNGELAGKTFSFECTLIGIEQLADQPVDESLAQRVEMESLDVLRERVRTEAETGMATQSREQLKIDLMDALSAGHPFELPPAMVEDEFSQIWARIEQARAQNTLDPLDRSKDEAELKADYQAIADRRVRLALLFQHVAESAGITASEEDGQRALMQYAMRAPQHEQMMLGQMMQQNEKALIENFRGTALEEKIVDYILEQAQIETKEITSEEFEDMMRNETRLVQSYSGVTQSAADHHDHNHDHDYDHDHHDHDHSDHEHADDNDRKTK